VVKPITVGESAPTNRLNPVVRNIFLSAVLECEPKIAFIVFCATTDPAEKMITAGIENKILGLRQ
jgi:hypothetical protein